MTHAVVVARIYAPEPAAASFRLRALVDGLLEGGADVTVLTSIARAGSDPADDVVPAGARGQGGRVPRLQVLRRRVLRDRDGYVRGYVPYLSFDVPAALRLLTVRRPDVVVVEPPPTTGAVVRVVCALRRVPYVYYAADVLSDAAQGLGTRGPMLRLLRALEGWAMRGAGGVLAVSDHVATRVESLAGPGRTRTGVVRHGIDTHLFTPAPTPEPAGPAAESAGPAPEGAGLAAEIASPVAENVGSAADRPAAAPARFALYTGTASAWHGADVFVRAMPDVLARVPDAHLVVLGQGSQWPELTALARTLAPDHIHLRPTVPPAEVARWLRAADVALASMAAGSSYEFALPTKMLAATATGTPVVYAGPGPGADLVRDGDLGLAVPHDPSAVADALVALLTDPETTDPTRRAARAERLAAWAREHASVAQRGREAAAHVRGWASQDGRGAPAPDGDEDRTAP